MLTKELADPWKILVAHVVRGRTFQEATELAELVGPAVGFEDLHDEFDGGIWVLVVRANALAWQRTQSARYNLANNSRSFSSHTSSLTCSFKSQWVGDI